MTKLYDEKTFEREVFRIAQNVFSPTEVIKENYYIKEIDNKERDGYYEGEFVVHCLEVTVSRSAQKTRDDLSKLKKTIDYLNSKFKNDKAIRGFFITLYPLSPEQNAILKTFPSYIRHQDYHEFLGRLIDSQEYLRARENHTFGSIQSLNKKSIGETYVEPKLFDSVNKKKPKTVREISFDIQREVKKRILISGDFGSGKSVSGKQIFINLSKAHIKGEIKRFPVYLNLREFAELDSGDEALRRHAKRIGLSDMGEKLVRAWKAGYVILIIDGFDEVVPRISAKESKRIKDIKHQSLAIVRSIIRSTGVDVPLVVMGRSNFFSSEKEMQDNLGVDETWSYYHLDDFDETQTENLLSKFGYEGGLPDWLPRKPLLIAYFVDFDLFKVQDMSKTSASLGWRELLDKVCTREISQIDTLPIIKSELIEIYGRLALIARKRVSSVGPISIDDMRNVYKDMFNEDADGASLGQLMRLPFLIYSDYAQTDAIGSQSVSVGAKNFISSDLVDVASSIWLRNAYVERRSAAVHVFQGQKNSIGEAGIETLNDLFESNPVMMSDAMNFFNDNSAESMAQIDLLMAIDTINGRYYGSEIEIVNIDLQRFELDGDSADFGKVTIKDSFFEVLVFDKSVDSLFKGPFFSNCIGIQADVPTKSVLRKVFSDDCAFDNINDIDRTSHSYLQMSLDDDTKILCTVLQKVYVQSIKGRMESALKRGLNNNMQVKVDEVVDGLRKSSFIEGNRVDGEIRWHPVKKMRGQVLDFLEAPSDNKARRIVKKKTG